MYVGWSHCAKPIGCAAGLSLFFRETARERRRDIDEEPEFESQELTDFTSGTGSFQKAVGKVIYTC